MDPSFARSPAPAATGGGLAKDPLRHMTELQYREQAAAASKELRRLRKELATLREELGTAVLNHNAIASQTPKKV